ncbi:MAG TPA: hypothetical protein VE090_01400 [Methylomirabilota bacterium]|nr:hypothetical protein [Methylomirabilota bacterium]
MAVETLKRSPEKITNELFIFPYTLRHLWAERGFGSIDSYQDPFNGKKIQSGETINLSIEKGAFLLDFKTSKHEAQFHKLCNTFGLAIPVEKDEFKEFVASGIAITDSTGVNTHFENQTLLAAIFPPAGKEKRVLSFIDSLTPPENPYKCSDASGKLGNIGKEEEVSIHIHTGPNNIGVLAAFALAQHEPSLALLKKWFGEQSEFQGKASTDIAFALSERVIKEKKEQQVSQELTPKERADSIASILFAATLDQDNDLAIVDAVAELKKENYFGKLNIHQKQPEALRELNEQMTRDFTESLKTMREEVTVDPQKLTLLLLQMHDQQAIKKDLENPLVIPPATNKDAAILLAKAMEINTRPETEKQLSVNDRKVLEGEKILNKQGYFIYGLGTKHDAGPYHGTLVRMPNGKEKIELCMDHAKKADATLQTKQKIVINSVKNIIIKRTQTNQRVQPLRQIDRPRIGIPDKKQATPKTHQHDHHDHEIHEHHEEENILRVTNPTKMMLTVLNSKRALVEIPKIPENNETVWQERFQVVAEVAHAAVVHSDEAIQEQLNVLSEENYVGRIIIKQYEKIPEEQKKALIDISKEHTELFKQSLQMLREETPVDSKSLTYVLAKLHGANPDVVDDLMQTEKLPAIEKITDAQAGAILAIDMALTTQSKQKEKSSREKIIQEKAKELNEKGIYYIYHGPSHDGAFHFENLSIDNLRKGLKADTCPEHTKKADNKLKQVRDVVAKKVQNLAPKKTFVSLPLEVRRPIGGSFPRRDNFPSAQKAPDRTPPPSLITEGSERQPMPPSRRNGLRTPVHNIVALQSTLKKQPEKTYLREVTTGGYTRPRDIAVTSDPRQAALTIDAASPIPRSQLKNESVISNIGNAVSVAHTESLSASFPKESLASTIALPTKREVVSSLPAREKASTASDSKRLRSVRAAIQQEMGGASVTSVPVQTTLRIVRSRTKGAVSIIDNKRESTVGTGPTITVRAENHSASSRPALRLVKTEKGGKLPEQIPTTAKITTLDTAPILYVTSSPTDTPTISETITTSSGNPHIAEHVVTVGPAMHSQNERATISSRSKNTRSSEFSLKTKSEKGPSSPKPNNTLTPDQANTTQTQKMKNVSGEQTAKQVTKAFEKKQEQNVEQQVTQQLEQAAKSTTKRKEGENATSQIETEDKETVVQTKTGEFAKVRQKASTTSTGNTSHAKSNRSEINEQADEAPVKNKLENKQQAEKGTDETNKQQAQQRSTVKVSSIIAPTVQRAKRQSESQSLSLGVGDGQYLNTKDLSAAKDEVRNILNQLAA